MRAEIGLGDDEVNSDYEKMWSDVDKWQAGGDPELSGYAPEDLFPSEQARLYEKLHIDIWDRMCNLHGTLKTLEQLREFPFDWLYAPNGMEFWQLVVRNFLDIACVSLHALVSDQGRDVHTLMSFRSQIVKWPWLSEENRERFIVTLRNREFDKVMKLIAEKVESIRNNRIAHRIVDKTTGDLKNEFEGVSFDEFSRLFAATHLFFGALCFGSANVTLRGDLAPSMSGGKLNRSCLDEVLDAVLKSNYWVNEPELRGEWWNRDHISIDELKVLNQLRARIGLSGV
jgi:hypothetical protein